MTNTLSFGQEAAMQLYQALLPFTFFFCVIGIIIAAARKVDYHTWFRVILLTAVLAGATVGYPQAMQTLQKDLEDLRHSVNYSTAWTDALNQDLTQATKPPFYDVANGVAYYAALSAQFVGRLAVMFIFWLQGIAINGLICVCPIMLGMIALEWTRSIGINFLMTSAGVLLWSVGVAIVDVTLANLATPLLSMAGISGGIAAAATVSNPGGWVILACALLGMAILSIAMYLAVPFAVGALLKGANPLLTAVTAGVGLAGAGAEIATKAAPVAGAVGQGIANGAKSVAGAFSGGGAGAPTSAPKPSGAALAYPATGAGVPTGEERVGGFIGSKTRSGSGGGGAVAALSEGSGGGGGGEAALTSAAVPTSARSVTPDYTANRKAIMASYQRRSTISSIDAAQIQGSS